MSATLLADVLAPPNDEGTRATVLRWCKQVGDTVVKDEPLLELETDKVTVEVPAPADGTLIEVLKEANVEVNPNEVLARLRLGNASAGAAARTSAAVVPAPPTPPAESGAPQAEGAKAPTATGAPPAAGASPKVNWVPLAITVRVQGSEGPPVRLDTVRLIPGPRG